MKKTIIIILFVLTLFCCQDMMAQDRNITNYSFQERSLIVSKLPDIKINMIIGKTVVGVAASENFIVKGSSFFNINKQGNEILSMDENKIPTSYSLEQNYPNPFNPVTTIKYSIPQEGYVSIAVFNMLGEKVQQLVDENKSPGDYKYDWNAEHFTSGIYLYCLRAGNYTESKKLTLLK